MVYGLELDPLIDLIPPEAGGLNTTWHRKLNALISLTPEALGFLEKGSVFTQELLSRNTTHLNS